MHTSRSHGALVWRKHHPRSRLQKMLGPRLQLDMLAGKHAGFNKPKCKDGKRVNVDSRKPRPCQQDEVSPFGWTTVRPAKPHHVPNVPGNNSIGWSGRNYKSSPSAARSTDCPTGAKP
ncbi:uncharacterized protein UTRI_03509 [Ustilago trichophora]|uniref:Uncharacterized protein n=1 Tax=Ustilago trichophora TaxID=86804 RepID=A0A5C3E467_9BASI|nr:uncharacterized protein UTRI_03509 [Ustilago trichophora]